MAIRTSIQVGLDTRGIRQGARQGARHIRGFAQQSKRVLGGLSQSVRRSTEVISGPVGRFAGAAGLTLATKRVIDLDARLGQMLQQARKSTKGLSDFKKEVFEVALASGQGVDQVGDFIKTFVDEIGDLDAARKIMLDIAKASTATQAPLEALGVTAAQLKEKFNLTDEELLPAIDILNVQAKTASVSLQNLAPQLGRLSSAVGRFNTNGLEGVRVMGALVQSAKKGSGEVAQAITAVEGIVAEILDPQKQKQIRKLGFNPFEIDPTTGKKALKDLESIFKGIIVATKGDESKIGTVFGREAVKGVTRLAKVFRETGGFEEFDTFKMQGGDATETLQNFNEALDFTKTKLKIAQTQLDQTFNERLSTPIEILSDALTVLNNNPIITKGGIAAVLGIGGLGLGLKGLDILTRVFRGGKGLAGKAGLPGGGIPVRVTNTGVLGLGGAGTGSQARARALRRLGGLGRGAGALVGRAGLVGAAGAAGLGVGTIINRELVEGTAFGDKLGETLNKIAAFFGSEASRQALEINVRAEAGMSVETNAENTTATVNRGQEF